MIRCTIGWTFLMLIVCASPFSRAACLVDDADFTTASGGCKDLGTGLVWSPDLRALGASSAGQSGSNSTVCNQFLNSNPANGGEFTDWRPPTVGEIAAALGNGLNSHLDFFLNGNPDDGVYRWTACTQKIKGKLHRYIVRFTDGDTALVNLSLGIDGVHMVCVRGVTQPNDCPGGPGKKNLASATSALSQTATGALLLLPLGIVVAARCLRPRRPRATPAR
jgi:hypothetical protein